MEYFIESLLCIALSKSIGSATDGKPLASDLRMQYLNGIIKDNVNINEIETIINDNNESSENDFLTDDLPNEEINSDLTDWIKWSDFVLNSAKKIAENATCGNVINACYNPEFAKQLRTRLLPYLPIWTGIMRPYFKRSSEIVTSSSVEAEFGDLKNRSFKGKLPIKADKFVFQHLDYLDPKITLISNEKDISVTNNIPLQLDKDVDSIYNKNREPS